jgi:hypothetical protein
VALSRNVGAVHHQIPPDVRIMVVAGIITPARINSNVCIVTDNASAAGFCGTGPEFCNNCQNPGGCSVQ